jgi:ornithine decarboxylase
MAAPKPAPASPDHFADALAVAAVLQPEEALFCYSAAMLRNRFESFANGFPGTVSYAVKSNPARQVIATLSEAGLAHWDVASVHEMALVRGLAREPVFHTTIR